MSARVLCVDWSARCLGWAADRDGDEPIYGAIPLPGVKDPGRLGVQAMDAVTVLARRHTPDTLVWCREEWCEYPGLADAHAAVRFGVLFGAERSNLRVVEVDRRRVRQAVLGRGDFGLRDPVTNGLVPEGGRQEAWDAVMGWCLARRYRPARIEVGNALVLFRNCRPAGSGEDGRAAARVGHHHTGNHAG